MSSIKTLLASQPIYTSDKDLFGFELLFRHDGHLSASEYGADSATEEVLLNLCTGITEQYDLYSRPMFINLSKNLLVSDTFLPLPAEGTIIDLPRSIKPDADVLAAVKRLKNKGFSFALENFNFDPQLHPLVELVDYIKIDVLKETPVTLKRKMAAYKRYPVTWVAVRVEKEQQFIAFRQLGFNLFQGYFLARPLPVQGHLVRGSLHNSAGLINAVSKPELEIEELTKIVAQDPTLATQILKIVNSPACALTRTISSLKDAVTYLGLTEVRKWAIMIAMMNNSKICTGTIRLILTRAKACENYAATSIFANPDQAFLVGLLSGIQLLFGIEIELFMEKVRLQAEIEIAVVTQAGILGQILNDVLRIEQSIMVKYSSLPPQKDVLLYSYASANNWTEQVLSSDNS